MTLERTLLYVALGLVVSGVFLALWLRHALAQGAKLAWPTPVQLVIGAVTDFFDTLGVGSFATTTSLFKLGRVVADENIPGTLNVGHAVPTFAEAFIFILVIDVDPMTLASMIAAATVGAWVGAGRVSHWPRRWIQLAMGVLLIVAAAIIVARVTGFIPGGGDARALAGARLGIGLAGNFVLGALMTLGIGLYAPCMILVSLLGMNQTVAFPIMMGSCAFLMPAASVRFIRSGRYDLKAALGLTIAGTPAALVAGLVVKSLNLNTVKWMVVAVVVYTAIAMLRSAAREKRDA
jgi:uncharacterized membrane protein YfcA